MRSRTMRKNSRMLVFLLCGLILLTLLSSYMFIGTFSGHSCTSHHCDVCERLVFLSLLLRYTLLLSKRYLSFSRLTDQAAKAVRAETLLPLNPSPVAYKVRLNN